MVWQGKHTPLSAQLILSTHKPDHTLTASPEELENARKAILSKNEKGNPLFDTETTASEKQREAYRQKLKEVEQQQSDFE